ncbi:hypothetical protein MMC18_005737 [Xylographa bjoerkii]|nr:hypothetical protein [Xylographa bjoerkii]
MASHNLAPVDKIATIFQTSILEASYRQSFLALASATTVLAIFYQISAYIYNLYFHPLSRYPGPKLWAASRLPHEVAYVRGRIIHDLAALHKQYGDVVRVTPTGLSFISPEAWLDIYARKPGQLVFRKDEFRYTKDLCINGAQEILTADEKDHPRLRRVLAHAFSDKEIREQEPLVRKHVDVLMRQLSENSVTGAVDMSKWLNWATFDIIGDLAFGEPFGCLETGEYHPWVSLIFDTVQAVSVMGAIKQFPWLDAVFQRLLPDALFEKLRDHQRLSIAKVNKRLETKTDRGDFLGAILKHAGSEKEMTKGEIYSNAALLIMAGSETSATSMAGCIYYLAKNQGVLDQVRAELQRKCGSKKYITFDIVLDSLPYLSAVLEESMRLYPAQPIFTPRKAPKGGSMVAGHFVPENTTVGIYQWVAYHDTRNFHDPGCFDPTRWLDNPMYDQDRKGVFKPFSTGPRSCIAKKSVPISHYSFPSLSTSALRARLIIRLAYAEMRLILARLAWQFEIELVDQETDWTDQEVYWSWKKPALMVRLRERVTE